MLKLVNISLQVYNNTSLDISHVYCKFSFVDTHLCKCFDPVLAYVNCPRVFAF